jgi:hypothetical protein
MVYRTWRRRSHSALQVSLLKRSWRRRGGGGRGVRLGGLAQQLAILEDRRHESSTHTPLDGDSKERAAGGEGIERLNL